VRVASAEALDAVADLTAARSRPAGNHPSARHRCALTSSETASLLHFLDVAQLTMDTSSSVSWLQSEVYRFDDGRSGISLHAESIC
jgi:hypothetical protein